MLSDINTTDRTAPPGIAFKELSYIAFSGQRDLAHGLFRSLPVDRRKEFADKYILSEVIFAGVNKLHKFLSASAEEPAMDEKGFIDQTARLFLKSCRDHQRFPRELYESLLLWSDELERLSLLSESLAYYDEILRDGISSFPELHTQALVGKARLLNRMGNFDQAQELLGSLAERPYLLADRNLIPELMFQFAEELLLNGRLPSYKNTLFRGLRHFYSTIEDRRSFVEQITRTYRRSYRVLLDADISLSDRFLFGIHFLYFRMQPVRLRRFLKIVPAFGVAVLGYVYWLNYVHQAGDARATPKLRVLGGNGTGSAFPTEDNSKRSVLITRAMGGIGDLLMMTPGIHALRKKLRGGTVYLAVPRRYFPLFFGNPDVQLLDIHAAKLDYESFAKWLNFSDCPAARVESRSAPRVRRTRIDIFASAMGIGPLRRYRMDKRPRYVVADHERAFQTEFWKRHGLTGNRVIGVQLHSEEVYRDYPHMEELVRALAQIAPVVTFDNSPEEQPVGAGIVRVSGLPLRQAFALAAGCDVIVAPDSAFVHLAAALRIPCIGLYGPVDGVVRTRHYPECTFVDVREDLGCLPCWRNERIPCKLTNMRSSVCMNEISVNEVLKAVRQKLPDGGEQ